MLHKFMKIEQKMEYTHALMNNLETTRRNEKNRAKRFFKMIQALENKGWGKKTLLFQKL